MRRHRITPNRLTALVTVVVLTATLVGCSGTSSGSASSSTSPANLIPPSTTRQAPASSSASTTSAPTGPTRGAATSADAAAQLVAAWNAHDRVAAARIAVPQAVEGIFTTPDSWMQYRSCSTDDSLPQGGCEYQTSSGLVQISTRHRSTGWVVTDAFYESLDDGGLPANSGDAPDGPPTTTSGARASTSTTSAASP